VSDIFLHFASASSLGTWLEEQLQQLPLASRIFSTLELEEHVQVLKNSSFNLSQASFAVSLAITLVKITSESADVFMASWITRLFLWNPRLQNADDVLSAEKFEHLGFIFYFGEKGSENIPLSQNAPFFANSDPNMPAVPVPAAQLHDWLLQNIASTLEHITESRASAKENGPTSAPDQDVPMADVSASTVKNSSSPRGPNFIEGISKTSYVRKPNDLKGSSVKVY
ncbi:hypothetical protein MTR67_012542, partial [Solanum verrucosum]